ncbi:hypothetical protein MPSEU_000472700 [Mayamaea pseudoterrestris]|nr:hypothetical protein MPSEU_000472700 [Mayamaea pseudoterrestris]
MAVYYNDYSARVQLEIYLKLSLLPDTSDPSSMFSSDVHHGDETMAETPDQAGKRRQRPAYSPCTPPAKRENPRTPAAITVLVNRVDLFDQGSFTTNNNDSHWTDDETNRQYSATCPAIDSFRYEPPASSQSTENAHHGTIAVVRVPHKSAAPDPSNPWMNISVLDKSVRCPYGQELAKYWTQRRRLFRHFDQGIQLDESGWFSVTPEQIADHTAIQVRELVNQHYQHTSTSNQQSKQPFVILDAFGGCGGNLIAFAKLIPNALVVAVEVNRSKLKMAAMNANIYGIPSDRIVFCECNALFVLEHCYKDGQFVLDQPLTTPEAALALMAAMPPPVETEICIGGYQLGGIDVLPRMVHAVYMDPPWGGVDYNVLGKNGYDLGKNMWIERYAPSAETKPEGTLDDGFFDTFTNTPRTKAERKAQFNCAMDISNSVNGAELLKLAAAATDTHIVIYDLPRNINRESLGMAALTAGYRGNCKLEEHYLNRQLKTVTAFFGSDWKSLIYSQSESN